MAFIAHDDVLDALLDEIATCNQICICDTLPTTHAEAATTYMLAATAMTPGDGNSFAITNDTSGRKVTTDAFTDIVIANSGTAIYIALLDATNVQFVTECTSQVLTAAGLVTIPAFNINVQDPVTS